MAERALACFDIGDIQEGCHSTKGLSRQLKSFPTRAIAEDSCAKSEMTLVKKSGE